MNLIYNLFFFVLLSSSIASYGQQKWETTDNVLILEKDEAVPANTQKKGSITIRGRLFRVNDNYDLMMMEARDKAKILNGNIVKITRLKAPDAWSTSYRMWADVYVTDDLITIKKEMIRKSDSVVQTLIADTAKYALLYIYRPENMMRMVAGFSIYIDNKRACKLKNDSRQVIKIAHEGELTFYTSQGVGNRQSIDVKYGNVYFLKCVVKTGWFSSEPELIFRDNKFLGYYEYVNIGRNADNISYYDDIYQAKEESIE